MAFLIVELDGKRRAAPLPPRVLIGRKSMNHVVIDHRAVSRMHAWIDAAGGRYAVADVGSRTGTRVNGEPVTARRPLADGDEIRIGPARLMFHEDGPPPPDAELFEFPPEPSLAADDKGVLFFCKCGAPLWAGEAYFGHVGVCRHCRAGIAVPTPAGRAAAPVAVPVAPPPPSPRPPAAPPAPAKKQDARPRAETCGACQSAIAAGEEKTTCPDCGLVFHAECWAENYGCSAYGCPQVNALQPPPGSAAEALAAAVAERAAVPEAPPAPFPWEFALLAGSVFAALVGAVTFGVPAAAMAAGCGAYFARHRGRQRAGVVLGAAALALVGAVAGVVVSYILYVGTRRGS